MFSGLVTTLILVRLLDKEDFGLMALVNVVIGFTSVFLDMGISNAIIHKQDVTKNQLSTLFWTNIIMGAFFFVVVNLFSNFLGVYFDEPRLTQILWIISFVFIFYALGIQHKALLRKELLFKELAIISVLIVLGTMLCKIILAYLGFGVYALVYGVLLNALLTGLLFFSYGAIKIHTPKFIFQLNQMFYFIRFGLFQMGERSMNYFLTQFDTIIIGKVFDAEILGVYDVIKQILVKPAALVNPLLNTVSFPVFSKKQNDGQLLKSMYLKLIEYNSLVNFSIYIGLIVVAQPFLEIFLGKDWGQYTLLFSLIGVYFLVRSIINPIGNLLLAKGKVELGFYWGLGLLIVLPISMIYGSKFGVIGIATAILVIHIIAIIVHYDILVKKLIPCGRSEFFSVLVIPTILSLSMGVIVYLSLFLVSDFSTLTRFIVGVTVGVVAYVFFLYVFKRTVLVNLLGILKAK